MPELQQYEYRDLINVRKEILHRFEWVSRELEQIVENLQARRLSVADAQQRIDQPLVKEVTLTVRAVRFLFLHQWARRKSTGFQPNHQIDLLWLRLLRSKASQTCLIITRWLSRRSMLTLHPSSKNSQQKGMIEYGLDQVKTNGACIHEIYKIQKKIYTSSIRLFIEGSPRYDWCIRSLHTIIPFFCPL